MKTWKLLLTLMSFCLTTAAWADTAPACLGNGSVLPVNDAQVLQWKQSTPNQFLARAHVQGTLTRLYPNQTGHEHFEIQIGPDATDTLEVIFNLGFGTVPQPAVGDQVEACGDYITSNASTSQYAASPDDAIIHWIHMSDNTAKHPSGFLMINGVLYGQGQ